MTVTGGGPARLERDQHGVRAELCPDEKDRDGQGPRRPTSHIEDMTLKSAI